MAAEYKESLGPKSQVFEGWDEIVLESQVQSVHRKNNRFWNISLLNLKKEGILGPQYEHRASSHLREE